MIVIMVMKMLMMSHSTEYNITHFKPYYQNIAISKHSFLFFLYIFFYCNCYISFVIKILIIKQILLNLVLIQVNIMDTILKQIDELKNNETYEDNLSQIVKHCKDRLKNIKYDRYAKIISKKLLKSPFINHEFKSMFKCIKIIATCYERADYNVYSSKHIQIGTITFSRTYTGDNEGDGYFHCDICAEDQIVEISEEANYDELYKLTYSDEYYGDELLDIYKKLKFKTITQDKFLEYVIYIFTKIMDCCE